VAVVGRQGRGGSCGSRLEAGEGASLSPAEGNKARSWALRERGRGRRKIEQSGEGGLTD
jgi:hypothetical protein